jgi:glycosyltransferase involved in cell wall biosynthesis
MRGLIRGIRSRLKRHTRIVDSWRWLSRQASSIRSTVAKPRPRRCFDCYLIDGSPPARSKRALLSYVVPPLPLTPSDPLFFFDRSIYAWHTFVVAQILNRLGYVVDIINWDDASFRPRRRYELFFAHGGILSERIMHLLPPPALRIYWTSAAYWRHQNEEELKRLQGVVSRRGVLLPAVRYALLSEDEALAMADGVIGLGNQLTRETYREFPNVVMVNNMARPVDDFVFDEKDFVSARNHFLYYAGAGAVHKGLDLLLEAFSKSSREHLWIAGPVEPEFKELYRRELLDLPNIHYLGVIRPRGAEFMGLMSRCCYVIFPSCGEGQPHAVVECMAYGLIPVVSLHSSIEVGDFGVLIEPCTIDHITELVTSLSEWEPEQCQPLSVRARQVVAEEYSEERFTERVTDALKAILATPRAPGGVWRAAACQPKRMEGSHVGAL